MGTIPDEPFLIGLGDLGRVDSAVLGLRSAFLPAVCHPMVESGLTTGSPPWTSADAFFALRNPTALRCHEGRHGWVRSPICRGDDNGCLFFRFFAERYGGVRSRPARPLVETAGRLLNKQGGVAVQNSME